MTENPAPPRAKPASFVEIIDLWKTVAQFARDMGQPTDRARRTRVYQWRRRDFIDLEYWDDLIAAARKRHGVVLTKDDLHAMALASRSRKAAA